MSKWTKFLAARADVIDWLYAGEGDPACKGNDRTIAQTLSMDSQQVAMIRTRNRETDVLIKGEKGMRRYRIKLSIAGDDLGEMHALFIYVEAKKLEKVFHERVKADGVVIDLPGSITRITSKTVKTVRRFKGGTRFWGGPIARPE